MNDRARDNEPFDARRFWLSALFFDAAVALLLAGFSCLLLACASVSVETVKVKIPVAARAAPPAELTAPLTASLPVFVAPTDARATSALTAGGERDLQSLLLDLLTRLRAWAAWASPPESIP